MNKLFVCGICACTLLSWGCSQEAAVVVKPHKEKKMQVQSVTANEPKDQAPENESVAPEASKRENPFLSKEEEDALMHKELRVALSGYDLSAVFYAPPHSKVIINGGIFEEGDMLDNKEIVTIDAREIILQDSEGKYYLRVKELLQ